MFDNREVEYILYGIEENGANYAAALSQLFAVRFALNFIDAFADGRVRAAGHPLAVFIAALGYALKFSIDDVNRIGGGFAAPLIRNLTPSIRFAYHDYLRLFLFMNPSGENRLMRIATVIEYRGTDLTERQTYASGSVTTSVDLWFVPQLAQALGVVGVLDGEVEGNRYEFEKEANFSY